MDKELRKHIYIEFKYSDVINEDNIIITESNKIDLCEENGCIPNLDEYVDIVYHALQLCNTNITLTEEDFRNVSNKFFDSIEVYIINSKNNIYNGGYSKNNSGFTIKNGKVTYGVKIYLLRNKSDEDTLKVFAHEITHAYDDFNRKNKIKNKSLNRQSLYRKVNDKVKPMVRDIQTFDKYAHYNNITTSAINNSLIGNLLYYLFKTEINAYIGQTKIELMNMSHTISNTESAMRAIKRTEIYQIYNTIKSYINRLKEPSFNEKEKELMLNEFNQITNLNYNTYNQMVKFFNQKFNMFEKKIINKIPKIVYNIYKEAGSSNFERVAPPNTNLLKENQNARNI